MGRAGGKSLKFDSERQLSVRVFFFEKKKQKTFIQLVPDVYGEISRLTKLTKFFCFFLFTKRRLLLILSTIIWGRHCAPIPRILPTAAERFEHADLILQQRCV